MLQLNMFRSINPDVSLSTLLLASLLLRVRDERYGANPSAQTVEGYTPEQIARLRDSKNLLALLRGASCSS